MSNDNFEQLVFSLLDRRPFQVFTIEMNGGKRFEIDHPRAFTYRDGVWHYLAPGGIPIWFDAASVNHIFPAGARTPTGSQQ